MNYSRFREFLSRDTIISHILCAIMHISQHWICSSLSAVIGTIVIAVMIAKNYYGKWFWLACILYLFLLISSAFCQHYDASLKQQMAKDNEKNNTLYGVALKKNEALISTSDSLKALMGSSGAGAYRVARAIKHDGMTESLKATREMFGFQDVCFQACKEIYNICKATYPDNDFYITIFQRVERVGRKKNSCKMIAYYNKDHTEPSTYHVSYSIPPTVSDETKIEYHTRLFASGENQQPYYLENKAAIDRHFKFHKTNRKREERIKSYLGIPSTVCHRGITFLLQIDSETENAFGKDLSEAKWFIENILKQYVLMLSMMYEFDRLNEMADNRIREAARNDIK